MKALFVVFLFVGVLFSKEIVVKTDDGFEIKASLEMPKSKNIKALAVFAHQFGADSSIWNEFSSKLQDQGYATLLIDLRGHGKSIIQNGKENKIINEARLDHLREALTQSAKKVDFSKIPSDIEAILEVTFRQNKELNKQNIVLFGSSLGGGAMLSLTSLEPKGIIVISTGNYSLYGEDEVNLALASTTIPIMLVVGKDDPLGAQKRSYEYSFKSPFTTLIQVSSDGHGTVLLPKVENYIFDFLDLVSNKKLKWICVEYTTFWGGDLWFIIILTLIIKQFW